MRKHCLKTAVYSLKPLIISWPWKPPLQQGAILALPVIIITGSWPSKPPLQQGGHSGTSSHHSWCAPVKKTTHHLGMGQEGEATLYLCNVESCHNLARTVTTVHIMILRYEKDVQLGKRWNGERERGRARESKRERERARGGETRREGERERARESERERVRGRARERERGRAS